MKKSFFLLLLLFVLLTTYKPKFGFISNLNAKIQKIIVENNSILDTTYIKQSLSFLYEENLFLLNTKKIEKNLMNLNFVESFTIKKIYPNQLKVVIVEKKVIAILQNKKKKFYISDKGNLINFKKIEVYNNLPTVFGNGNSFYTLYKDLQNIKFPIKDIKSFYFFESGRWDLITHNDKIIKLPIEDYLFSVESFMNLKNLNKTNEYKTFDYRINNQLILN